MSTDFTVDIKIDDTGADQKLRKLHVGIDKADRAAQQAKGSFAGFTAQLEKAAQVQFGGLATQIGELGLAAGAVKGFASSVFGVVDSLASWRASSMFAHDGMIMMRNQLRNVTKGHEELGAAMDLTRSIADRTFTDWNTSVSMFARVSNVTNQLGFTMERTGAFTETLSKMFAQSGRSAGETSSAMLQLSQALGSGVLQGDEFRSIAENLPSLLDAFAARLGVTRGALKELASQGAITTEVMIAGIEDMAAKTDIAFAQMERTFAQRTQPMLNELKKPFAADKAFSNPIEMVSFFSDHGGREFAETTGIAGIMEAAPFGGMAFPTTVISEENKLMGEYAMKLKELGQLLGQEIKPAFDNWRDGLNGTLEAIKKHPPTLGAVDIALLEAKKRAADMAVESKGLAGALDEAGDSVRTVANRLLTSLVPGFDAWADGQRKVNHGLSETQRLFNELHAPIIAYETQIKSLDILYQRGSISATMYNDHLLKLEGALTRIESIAPRAAVGLGKVLGISVHRGYESSPPSFDHSTRSVASFEGIAGDANNAMAGSEGVTKQLAMAKGLQQGSSLTELWTAKLREHKDEWKAFEDVGTKALGHVEDSFVKLFTTGEFGFKQMVDGIISDLVRMATHQVLMSLIGGIGGRSFGPGFSSFYGTGASQAFAGKYGSAPGYAEGGSFRVGGHGGTDSQFVPIWATPGERVTIQTPMQQRVPFFPMSSPMYGGGMGGNGGGNMPAPVVHSNTRVVLQQDPRALLDAIQSSEGEKVIHKVLDRRRR